ncbi:MAG: aspartate aminotransferase family protein [Candidatus Jordarchaeum sp.]|uniref:aspartate aminotransferase family protein n=1 Tax=Candidatus Jordarchaeum sp. TaxID=2823881 RepID=UPI0040498F4D
MKQLDRPKIVTEIPGPKSRELWKLHEKYIPKSLGMDNSIFVEEAKGALLKDVDGNVYIDFAGAIGTVNAGHCPPEVVQAVKEQTEKLIHTGYQVVPYEVYIRLAEKLCNITPGSFKKKALIINSGVEAVENAVKIAIHYTNKPIIITFENAFHGRTRLGMALTSKVRPYKFGFNAYIYNMDRYPYAYCYRCRYGLEYPSCGLRCLHAIEEGFAVRYDPEEIAVIIVEPIQGEGGFIVPPDDWFPGLRKICDKYEIVLIDDEIQAGMGRTGKMFCVENYGVAPDIITVAKSIASGFPISATIGKAEMMDVAQKGGLGTTFGGSPISCVAALETIKIIENGLEHAQDIGEIILKRLHEMQEKHEIIGDVRGKGPMAALELVKDKKTKEPAKEETKKLVENCNKKGLITLRCGIYDNVIRILVPLIIEEELLEVGLDIMDETLKEIK